MNLNSEKVACHGAIPAKILKQFCDSYLHTITKIINKSITEVTFPSELKLAEWKRALDENMKIEAIYMDLSMAFDTLNQTSFG